LAAFLSFLPGRPLPAAADQPAAEAEVSGDQGITREELDELKAGILALAGLPADTVPFDLGPREPFCLPPWPPHMAGCWYERDEGWGRYGPNGREQVPAEVIADAGLPAVVDLPDGLNTVFLTAEPFRNLVPRRQP
jgi:hypothetical protein